MTVSVHKCTYAHIHTHTNTHTHTSQKKTAGKERVYLVYTSTSVHNRTGTWSQDMMQKPL